MSIVSLSIAKFTALETFHNRLLWLISSGAFVGIGIGLFGNALAITESQEIQTAFMSSSLRFISVLIISLTVVTSISRELHDKNLDMLLSLAITRTTYFFGKIIGFSIITFFTAVVFGLCLLISATPEYILIWSISLFCELFIVLCFSMLCALSLRQVPLAIIVVMGFYILSRSIQSALLMINAPMLSTDSVVDTAMIYALQGISYLIPDFSIFTRSEWLIYESVEWSSLSRIFLQTFSYFILLSGASLFDFYRKSI